LDCGLVVGQRCFRIRGVTTGVLGLVDMLLNRRHVVGEPSNEALNASEESFGSNAGEDRGEDNFLLEASKQGAECVKAGRAGAVGGSDLGHFLVD